MSTHIALIAPVINYSASNSALLVRFAPAWTSGSLTIYRYESTNATETAATVIASGTPALFFTADGSSAKLVTPSPKFTASNYLHVVVDNDGEQSEVMSIALAPHVRTQIRNAITVLLHLDSDTPDVYSERELVIQDAELPALSVRTPIDEPNYDQAEMGCAPQHTLSLLVEGYVKSSIENLAQELDQIAADVEEAIYGEPTLYGLVEAIALGPQEAEYDAENDKPIGIISMQYSIFYRAQEGTPTAIY